MSQPKFGTAGAGDLFYSKGFKHSYDVPAFLADLQLDAFEYQCGRGVRIGQETAGKLRESAKANHIALSIHAPYFINLSVDDPERWEKNAGYFLDSARAAKEMGAVRVVFHPGGVGKMSRGEAFSLAERSLDYVWKRLNEESLGDIIFCPETMGKINQLGDLDEVLQFCRLYETMLPCIDFGHMNSRNGGSIKSMEDYAAIFTAIENAIGVERARVVQCHFSKIEYNAGGEKRHLTFEDTIYGPDYEPLMELLYKKNYTPTIICESAGTQAEDALLMAQYYRRLGEGLLGKENDE